MTLEKARYMNLRGYRNSLWTSLAVIVTLLVPAARVCAQTDPMANAAAKRSAKVPAAGGDQSIRPYRIKVPQDALVDLRRRLAASRPSLARRGGVQ